MELCPPDKQFYPFQLESIMNLSKRRHGLLAHEMGLGKSCIAVGVVNSHKIRTVLITCPASIKRNWEKTIKEWVVTPRVIQIVDKKTDFITDLAEVVIVNYDIISHSYIHQQLMTRRWGLLIMDEAHRLKNMSAKRTVAVLSKDGLVRVSDRTLALTGTPILNRPEELYPILRVLAPAVIAPYSDFFKFAKRYCDAYKDGFGFNTKGASHTDELNLKLREHYMERKMTYEVEVQLPKKRYEMVFIDSEPGVKFKIRTLDQATRRDFKYQTLEADGGRLATLRREIAEEKVRVCIEQIKEYVESTEKIVIFAYHRSVINTLITELECYGVVHLHGGCSQSARADAIRDFQNNPKTKVFIGQIDAAGEGIDGLQEVCHNALFVEWSWVPGAIEQACKRLHRIGQTKPVLLRFLVWADSIEEHMMRVALDKVKVIKEILK